MTSTLYCTSTILYSTLVQKFEILPSCCGWASSAGGLPSENGAEYRTRLHSTVLSTKLFNTRPDLIRLLILPSHMEPPVHCMLQLTIQHFNHCDQNLRFINFSSRPCKTLPRVTPHRLCQRCNRTASQRSTSIFPPSTFTTPRCPPYSPFSSCCETLAHSSSFSSAFPDFKTCLALSTPSPIVASSPYT